MKNKIFKETSDTTFLVKLIRCMVGFEESLVEDLASENSEALHFKVFGRYDILEIARLEDLTEAIRANSNCRILDMNSFPCFCWNEKGEEFWYEIRKSVSLEFSLLKLQECIFHNRGLSGIDKVCNYLSTLADKSYALCGMGYYEIVLWLPANNFESIFHILEKLRDLKIGDVFPSFAKKHRQKGLFTDTTTTSLVSYNTVIRKKQWSRLKGKVMPLVKIKCAPGYDHAVARRWPKACYHLLGADDLLYFWSKPVKLSYFISKLMGFRETGATTFSVFDTTTRLLSTNMVKIHGAEKTQLPVLESPAASLDEQLRKLAKLPGVNQFIISEIINIVSLMNYHMADRLLKLSYPDIVYSILHLNGLLDEYGKKTAEEKPSDTARIEDYLLRFADCVRIYMAQQFPGSDLTDLSNIGPRLPFACSLSRLIKAISVIPEQLFLIISRSKPPVSLVDNSDTNNPDDSLTKSLNYFHIPWRGFLFLDLAEGYQVITQGEIFYVPYKDIFRPIDWITLSHEVSHAYYSRIFFELLEADYLKTWVGFAESKLKDAAVGYAPNLFDSCFEFFAHWFDYRHFFDGDFDFYLWSIWRTWFTVPRIYEFTEEYWLRSIFVKLCHSWPTIKPKLDKIHKAHGSDWSKLKNELKKLFQKELDYVSQFLNNKFQDQYGSISLDKNQIGQVIEQLIIFYDLARKFEESYVSDDIINDVNLAYPNLDEDVHNVLCGKTIKRRIPNPFLLLREILRTFYMENNKGDLSDISVVALVYSLWETSRHFRRHLDQSLLS